jgi:hypothetical protein
MKKILFIFALLITSLFSFGQQKQIHAITTGGDSVVINVSFDKVKLPLDDEKFYEKMDNLVSSNAMLYDGLSADLQNIESVVTSLAVNQNEMRLTFITNKFGLTEDKIAQAFKRDANITFIAVLLPLLAMLYLWYKMFKYQELDRGGFVALATTGLLVAVVSFFVLYYGLTSLFNSDFKVLSQLQSIF